MNISLVLTTALMAGGGAVLYTLRSIPTMIYNKIKQQLVYKVSVYQYDVLFGMLEDWLSTNHQKQYKDVEAMYEMEDSPSQPNSRPKDENVKVLSYKHEDNMFIINYMNKRIIIQKTKEKLDKAQSLKDVYFRKYMLSGIRAKKQVDFLLKETIQMAESKMKQNVVNVRTNNSYGDWFPLSNVKVKPIEKTIFNPIRKKELTDDIDRFLSSEEWYTSTCIPYKRGYCLYGPPGTGKTTLALALANSTKRDIFCLNLNCMDDDRIPYCFSGIKRNSILLIEDIDKVFSGRENVKEDAKITFSSVLNCLDGAFYRHGLITIITTNHVEKLDEALLRTGRVDMKIEVPLPEAREISEYLSIFYDTEVDISGSFSLKMSDVQEICIKNRNNLKQAIKEIRNERKLSPTYSIN